jgi:tetratricopeptide (TPR) repeat protein
MVHRAIIQRLALFVVLLIFIGIGAVSAQDALAPGDRVLIDVGRMPVRTAPEMSGPIAAEVLRGMVSRVVAVQEDADGRTWLYLANNAYGWVLDTIEGEPTVIPYTDAALEQIITEATAIIETNPNDIQAYVERGTAYLSQRNYEASVADYTSAINLAPGDYRLLEYRGKAYLDSIDYEAVIRDIDVVTLATGEVTELTANTYNRAGIAHQWLENLGMSVFAYERALEIEPTYGVIYSNMGTLFDHYEMYDNALNHFAQAIEHDPYLSNAYVNRAITYQHLADYDAALTDFNTAIEVDPYDVHAYVRRAIFYSEVYRDWDAALMDYNRAIAIAPYDDRAYAERAVTYMFLGETELAIDDLKYAIELNPGNAHAYYNLAALYGNLGRYAEAVETYSRVMEINDRWDQSLLLYRPQGYIALNDYDLALADLDQFLADLNTENPDNLYFETTAYLIRGNVHAYLGDYDSAALDYQTALSTSYEFAVGYYVYGAGYRITTPRESLIGDLQSEAEANPDDPDAQLRLALLYLEFGRWQEARTTFQRYRELVSVPPQGLDTFISTLESLVG